VIEKDKSSEWIIIRGKALGKNSEIRHKFAPMYYDLESRFKDMARMGVDRHVLSVRPELMFYGLEAGANKELAASMNDGLSALAREYPEKFSCMATVPLQDPSAAAKNSDGRRKQGISAS